MTGKTAMIPLFLNLLSLIAPTLWVLAAGALGIGVGAYGRESSRNLNMTVLPIAQIPRMQQRYLNEVPPAGLVVLSKPNRILPPAAMDGNGLPPSTITPYSGIYDESGKLPVPQSNLTFLGHA